MKQWGVLCLFAGLLWSCSTSLSTPHRPEVLPPFDTALHPETRHWWNDRVFYEVYVRAFQNSDGEGKGDLKGLISRLDYLNDGIPGSQKSLGVTGLWLMPIFESPSSHGYDATDYLHVKKDYGTEEDLKTLVREAHKRGMKVILDLVLNHTSDKHPWFQEALRDPKSPYRDYYLLRTEPFPEKDQRVKTPSGVLHYYGFFGDSMPDLNYRNPKVTQEMYRVADYWLQDTGIDGYRLDAAKYLIEDEDLDNTAATHDWFKAFFKHTKQVRPDAFLIGEVWDSLAQIRSYTGDQLDMGFLFPFTDALTQALRDQDPQGLERILSNTVEEFPAGQYAPFIRNHDQPRLMREFAGDQRIARLASGLLLALPGVPFLYYGEEIGMASYRGSMEWAKVSHDPGSLWTWYRRLLDLRNRLSHLRTGTYNPVDTQDPSLLSFVRWDEEGSSLVLANFSDEPQRGYGLTLWNGPYKAGLHPRVLISSQGVFQPSPPEVTPEGGFVNWRPVETLEPRSITILALDPSPKGTESP